MPKNGERNTKPRISERKLRLYFVACCFLLWDQLKDEPSRQAVLVVERYADQLATDIELMTAMSGMAITPFRLMEAAWETFTIESVHLLHEIYNPHTSVLAPFDLRRHNGIDVQLSEAIYYNKSFDQMPILADALEESGCSNLDILAHLRGPGPHIRGCWALDTILGRY